jgi:hypothetical protein
LVKKLWCERFTPDGKNKQLRNITCHSDEIRDKIITPLNLRKQGNHVPSTMAAIISVYAQFPKNVVPNTELDLDPANWEWQECLAFPVQRLNDLELSFRPYKWIRYATGVVVGARGDLCTERDLPNPISIDYDSGLSTLAASINLYYHTTDEEKCRMFPIDRNLVDTRTATCSTMSMSTNQALFCEDVEERDGCCVVSGDPPEACEAIHLLSHSKGDMV